MAESQNSNSRRLALLAANGTIFLTTVQQTTNGVPLSFDEIVVVTLIQLGCLSGAVAAYFSLLFARHAKAALLLEFLSGAMFLGVAGHWVLSGAKFILG